MHGELIGDSGMEKLNAVVVTLVTPYQAAEQQAE